MGDARKIAVVVEDVEAARIALRWALHNIVRYGDIITLLHVYPPTRSRSKNRARLLRLQGFQLALSFQHICDNFPSTKVEIIVTEGDQDGIKIAETVREIQASMLVVGLHDRSFLYKLATVHNSIASNFNCRVLAIKHPPASQLRPSVSAAAVLDSSTNLDFSQIHLSTLQVAETPATKIPYRICPDPSAIFWRSRRR
ncbi:hypothetical protein QN277_014573 [Acacia crassicarpa]|uniref:UspA domain-containing protein n=1 Tax=Acacia crassicarpa TaxID=499986 RepID=A0AAE1M5J9_9FABA|nr:hypothetical protein K1719_029859 [Acacia pycnantha]KAK4252594.1 hypothetical protein QN277_014573 [Acacia crassicarpa]